MSISDLTYEDLEQLLAVTSKEEFLSLSKELHKHCLINIDDLEKIMNNENVKSICNDIKNNINLSINDIEKINSNLTSDGTFELPDFFLKFDSKETALNIFLQNYTLYNDSIKILCESYKSLDNSDNTMYETFSTLQKNAVKYMVQINEVKAKINNRSNIEMEEGKK